MSLVRKFAKIVLLKLIYFIKLQINSLGNWSLKFRGENNIRLYFATRQTIKIQKASAGKKTNAD